jgi:hypothetical protein
MESYHRDAISKPWETTSQRIDTNQMDIANRILEFHIQKQQRLCRLFQTCSSKDDMIRKMSIQDKPIIKLITCQFKKAVNCQSHVILLSMDTILPNDFMHPKASIQFMDRMLQFIPENRRYNKTYKVITGIKYKGTDNTEYTEGILYCTPNLMQLGKSKYSAISFTYDNSEHLGVLVSAVEEIDLELNNIRYIFHVALLIESEEIIVPEFWKLKRYKFTSEPIQILCIYADQMLDHLFMYTDYSPDFINILSTTELNDNERYWLIPRILFDRRDIEEAPDYCDLSMGSTVPLAREYIRTHQPRSISANLNLPTIPEHLTRCNSFYQRKL